MRTTTSTRRPTSSTSTSAGCARRSTATSPWPCCRPCAASATPCACRTEHGMKLGRLLRRPDLPAGPALHGPVHRLDRRAAGRGASGPACRRRCSAVQAGVAAEADALTRRYATMSRETFVQVLKQRAAQPCPARRLPRPPRPGRLGDRQQPARLAGGAAPARLGAVRVRQLRERRRGRARDPGPGHHLRRRRCACLLGRDTEDIDEREDFIKEAMLWGLGLHPPARPDGRALDQPGGGPAASRPSTPRPSG